MVGAAIAAVAAQIIERILIGWKAARVVDARLADLALYIDLFKVTGVTIAAGLGAYAVRNLINPNLLILRIAAVAACLGGIYLAGMFWFRLPGREVLSRERIFSLARSTWARMSSA
jgi:hypothetical protein